MSAKIYQSLFIAFSLFISGCASLETQPARVPVQTVNVHAKRALTKISHVTLGMSYQEVVSMMNQNIKIGYQASKAVDGAYEAISVKNPYRVEILNQSNKLYNVLYYFSQINNPDGLISDDELTPCIFYDQKLIGQGWDDLNKLKQSRDS